MGSDNKFVVGAIIALVILIGIIILSTSEKNVQVKVSELLTTLSQEEREYLLLSFDGIGGILPDFIESAPPDFTGRFFLRSVNGGEWYAIRFVDDVAIDVLGTAEEVYPGLPNLPEAERAPANILKAQEDMEHELRVSEFIANLSQKELEYLLLSYNAHIGGNQLVGFYYLRSINGGEWYATTWPDAESTGEVLGTAEEVHPGLLNLLEVNRGISYYEITNRRIPKEEFEQTEEEKALLAAHAAAQQQFEELNKKD